MATKNYTVEGMTCGHCELSVQEQVSEIPGVREANADHATGTLTVSGEGFSDIQVADAVIEAGYHVQ